MTIQDFCLDSQYHTPECIERARLDQERIAEWKATWPDHCRRCGAEGTHYYSGDLYEPPSTEPCEHCTEKGLCARCGKPGLTNEDEGRGEDTGSGPCTFCGWNYDDRPVYQWECDGCTPFALHERTQRDEALMRSFENEPW